MPGWGRRVRAVDSGQGTDERGDLLVGGFAADDSQRGTLGRA
jgi:hypothetical protein